MSKGGYKIFDQDGMYFVSFAVIAWLMYLQGVNTLISSLEHCQLEQGLIIYGWCIMSNHVHLVISAREDNVSNVLGNFKKFTSKKIVAAIQNNVGESRRECLPD